MFQFFFFCISLLLVSKDFFFNSLTVGQKTKQNKTKQNKKKKHGKTTLCYQKQLTLAKKLKLKIKVRNASTFVQNVLFLFVLFCFFEELWKKHPNFLLSKK